LKCRSRKWFDSAFAAPENLRIIFLFIEGFITGNTRQGTAMKARKKGRYQRKERGAAIVEFALTATVLFALILGILDFSYLFLGNLSMQHAVREGARYAVTGQSNLDPNPTGTAQDRCDAAVAEMRHQSMGFFDRVSPTVVFSTVSTGTPPVITPIAGNSCAAANQIIVITVNCTLPLLTPIVRSLFTDGEYAFAVSATMKNEAF
jgi:Flp pilus assembly protein TadG